MRILAPQAWVSNFKYIHSENRIILDHLHDADKRAMLTLKLLLLLKPSTAGAGQWLAATSGEKTNN